MSAAGSADVPELDWLAAAGRLRVLADIHATVELERALASLGADPALAGTAAPDVILGARIVVVAAAGTTIAVAEPSTEGRLAATLVRHGEGFAGRYVLAPTALREVRQIARARSVLMSNPADGPFGPQVLVLGGSIAGPHLLLVDPAAVPSGR